MLKQQISRGIANRGSARGEWSQRRVLLKNVSATISASTDTVPAKHRMSIPHEKVCGSRARICIRGVESCIHTHRQSTTCSRAVNCVSICMRPITFAQVGKNSECEISSLRIGHLVIQYGERRLTLLVPR